jgi:hypothetical protein
VEETIKGKDVHKIEFADWSYGPVELIKNWKDSQRDVIWFLTRDEAKKKPVVASANGKKIPAEWIPSVTWYGVELVKRSKDRLSTYDPPPIFSMDLTVLESGTEILAAARKAVQDEGARPPKRNRGVNISHAIAQLTKSAGDVNVVTVPVDGRLEKAARRWINAPDETLRQLDFDQVRDDRQRKQWRSDERSQLREEGVKALKYFPSDENITLLRGLLNDPAWAIYHSERADGTRIEKKTYFVRKAAYLVLKKWDVEVERPVIEEPTDAEMKARDAKKGATK